MKNMGKIRDNIKTLEVLKQSDTIKVLFITQLLPGFILYFIIC